MQWMSQAQRTRNAPAGAVLPISLEPLGTNKLVLRDRTLFAEGDEALFAYRLLSGVVRVCKLMPDGRRHVVDFLQAGDLLGFEPGEGYSLTAEAVSDCVVCCYPRRRLDQAAETDPALSRRLLALTCARLAAAQARLMELGRKSAEERLASFLLSLAESKAGNIALPMGRADIADHLGLTVETVSRLFAGLRKARVIDFTDPHGFVVIDGAALQARSGASALD